MNVDDGGFFGEKHLASSEHFKAFDVKALEPGLEAGSDKACG